MTPVLRFLSVIIALVVFTPASAHSAPELDELRGEFAAYSGAELVFTRAELPSGTYYDVMNRLTASRRVAAAAIAVRQCL
jgi:hypothetical protein